MTKARRAGSIWTGFAGRHCGRAKALLVALPLLMLPVLVDHGLAGTTAPHPGNRVDSHASDMAGTEGKAQPPGRGAMATVEPLRVKPKLSGNGNAGPHGLAPATGLPRMSPLPRVEPRRAQYAAPTHWRGTACPRAPPVQAA